MPTQIYAATGTFPLKIRESVSTRFSGLLEYSATYLAEKGTGASGFSIGQVIATSSGIVKIFPSPRVTRSNDSAFDEVEVTAYGKGTLANSSIIRGTEFLELSKTYTQQTTNPDQTWNWTVYEIWLCQTATLHSVLLNSSTSYQSPQVDLDKTMVRRWEVGSRPSVGTIALQINWNESIRNVSRTNYGEYDEVAAMKGYTPQVQ